MKVSLKPGELSRLLDEKGLRKPYRTMAKELGCSRALIGHYLTDKVTEPSIVMLVTWARYLGVTVEDLLVVEDDENEHVEGE